MDICGNYMLKNRILYIKILFIFRKKLYICIVLNKLLTN